MLGDLYLLLAVQAGQHGVAVDGRVEGVLGVCGLVELGRLDHRLLAGWFCLSRRVLGDELLPELERADIVIGLSVLSGSRGHLVEILSLLEHVAGDCGFGAVLERTHHRQRRFHLNFIYQ